ncbi:ergosterol biosynthesis ERG4/ERG24 [Penicillium malachiteum]|uniref:7-dehydrocholesterol reductase n=1 Tax=Penicillium malachiteum TaxID=1324776 RepID=A0AAD6MQU4_9EURO|nr:ergosterol biosynthesis ERG4/ERG24 [Penicillium malachiteum]
MKATITDVKSEPDPNQDSLVFWGRRKKVSAPSGLLSLGFMLTCPLFVIFLYVCTWRFDSSIEETASTLVSYGLPGFFLKYTPSPTLKSIIGYTGWLVFQAVLYSVLPGKRVTAPPTPGGNTLVYRVNGLNSWIVTIIATVILAVTEALPLSSIADHWGGLVVAANAYGILATLFGWMKGHLVPSATKDRRFSGSLFHDLLSGIELNPRIGSNWDIKLYQIGRVGMNAWVLIDLSFAAMQYQKFGAVTSTMLVPIALHTIYTVDFFVNEDWYLSTIDICHDHFGFSLAWGPAAWLPMIYTCQTQYLASNPVELPYWCSAAIFAVGVAGYIMFRSSNHQKYLLRQSNNNCLIWGKKPIVIQSQYTTADSSTHSSLLLCSGWWGAVRHPNYVGDILFSLCTGLCAGFTHILPWAYFIFMTTLLVHRALRDEARCRAKHGVFWQEYCENVRWILIPYVF